jgi:hypothetical protein
MVREKRMWLASAVGGVFVMALVAGWAQANHVRIDAAPTPPPPMPATVTPQVLQVDEIKAQQVRANTIYANRIEADQVQGMIHQTDGVQIRNARGDIKAPDVAASTIYADTIKANVVVADAIYVRDLRLK